MAFGCSTLSWTMRFSLKISCTMQLPGQRIMSRPVCFATKRPRCWSGPKMICRSAAAKTLIVATEEGVLHQMRREAPDKTLIPAPPEDDSCACNQCPHMKLNTMEKLYRCMRDQTPSLELNPLLQQAALKPLARMLEWS